jgi:hypothetical protein
VDKENQMGTARGLLVWSLLAATALVGCGGGNRSAHQHALSKAEFLSRADAVCSAGNTRIDALEKPTDMPAIATYMAEALPIAEEIQAKLDALVPPALDQKKYARLLSLIAQSVSKVPEVRSAAEVGEEKRVQRLSNDLAALQQRENGAEEELGLKQCVGNGEAEA